jgi:hypothetical protein
MIIFILLSKIYIWAGEVKNYEIEIENDSPLVWNYIEKIEKINFKDTIIEIDIEGIEKVTDFKIECDSTIEIDAIESIHDKKFLDLNYLFTSNVINPLNLRGKPDKKGCILSKGSVLIFRLPVIEDEGADVRIYIIKNKNRKKI